MEAAGNCSFFLMWCTWREGGGTRGGRRPLLEREKEMVARGMAGAPSDPSRRAVSGGKGGSGGQGTGGMAPDIRRQADRFLIFNAKTRRREGFFQDFRDI